MSVNIGRELTFGTESVRPDVRKLNDMKDVIYDIEWLKTAPPDMELYYMYRDLALSRKDRSMMLDNGLRYDITVIPAGRLGVELVKTAGHYHPMIEGTGMTYPEIYEVLSGKAHYLLQRCDADKITDVIMVEAEAGDKVLIPPNYGHVTINPSPNKELKMANWVSRNFTSIYEPYKKCGGGAYYELSDGALLKNARCADPPAVRRVKPSNIGKAGLKKGKEMYGLIREPEMLAYLNRPQDFDWLWKEALT